MENETIKKVLLENLKHPDNDCFNRQIIDRLDRKETKQPQVLFSEKALVSWFLVIAVFVLVFYMQEASGSDISALLVGCFIAAIPLYLMVFNKIYLLKNNTK